MATIATPEESARKILSVFVGHFNLRPGGTLLGNNLMICNDRGMTSDEINQGMEYAVQHGWIEATRDRGYRLTEAGFAEA